MKKKVHSKGEQAIDKHLDLFFEFYKAQSKKSVGYAQKYCDCIAHRLKHDTSLPGIMRQDLIEIFSTGAAGQSIDVLVGLVPRRGQKRNNDPASMFDRDYEIWQRVSDLHSENPVLSDCCVQLEDEFHLGARRIEQIYSEMQRAFEEKDS